MKSKEIEYDIAILGHIAKDIIVIDDERINAIGGAVYYGGIAGSHMGLKIFVITRLKKEDEAMLSDFKKYGVQYQAIFSDETSGIENTYKSSNFEYRTCKPLGFAGLFNCAEIPLINTKYFILGPIMAGEIDIKLLEQLAHKYPNKICIDIQGFVRVRDPNNEGLYFSNLEQTVKEQILSNVEILKLDHAEAKALTKKDDIKDAAKELITQGPKEILISHEKGISVYLQEENYFFPWKYKAIKGRTGRGDTAFVSYIGSRLSKGPEESLKYATALTSLKLEMPGPFTLPLNLVDSLIKEQY